MARDLLSNLNPEQREAVVTTDGPVLVLAGAGSGKTRVIIHRIAHLLAEGVPAGGILAVTFTNKAANEMRERIVSLVSKERTQGLTISTFHSFGLWMVRRSKHHLGLSRHASVIDEADRNSVVRQVRSELGITEKDLTLEETENYLMQVKGCGLNAGRFAATFGYRKATLLERFLDNYTRRLRLAESLDFDDLILLPVNLLENNRKVQEQYRESFSHIMVDEYQDTNLLQFRFLKQLVGPQHNICVVGDDDQSIYGWRGARVENILEFDKEFPNTRVVKLTRNYRSRKNILQLANSLIAQNRKRHSKALWTDTEAQEPAVRLRFETQAEEARGVAERIRSLTQGKGLPAREMAVLYRTRGQAKLLQEMFRMNGVPYRVVGSYDFFERKEVRDVLAYLKLVCNPHDQASFRRVVNYPARGIGLVTLEKIDGYREDRYSSMRAAGAFLEQEGAGLNVRTRRALRDFLQIMEHHNKHSRDLTGEELIRAVEELLSSAGVRDDLIVRGSGPYKAMTTLLAMLRRGIQEGTFSTLPEFLERITLEQREAEDAQEDERGNLVTLMTVHSAKGLEFDAVFMVGLVDGIFPHFRAIADDAGLEEERRLFYVALTRARKRLFLSTFRQREERGEVRPSRPSRFLKELPQELLEKEIAVREEYISKADILAAFDKLDLDG
jgi:DNA helicase II / ATP-dependent DNA helicase PcrA